jgi:hypothetical protein
VPEYKGAAKDKLFKPLLALLREAATYEDVRPFLREKFHLRELLEKQGKLKGPPKEGQEITLEAEMKTAEMELLC